MTAPPGTVGGRAVRWTGPISLLDRPVRYVADRPDRLDGPPTHTLAVHLRRLGPAPGDAAGLLETLEAGALSGRGGAHRAVVAKWRRALARGGPQIVVGNGAESEPVSAKDAALLQHRPHLVLDGLALAVRALGAAQGVLWIHGDRSDTLAAVAGALRERGAAGVSDPPLRVALAPAGYLSGESTAIGRALAGGPALPTGAERDRGALHTLVQNVETLAWIALLAREGNALVPGALVTVLADGIRTVLDVAPGENAASAVRRASPESAPEPAPEPVALLVGGYGGTWLPWPTARDLSLSGADRSPLVGAGVLATLPPGACGLAETAAVLGYLARSGAGQCGPCRFGLPAMAALAARLARGAVGRRDVERLRRYAAEVDGRGACHHPDGAVRLLLSALVTFEDDVAAHVRRGRCAEGRPLRVLPLPRAS